MAGIEKYYEITEVYAWQWDGNANITIEDIPEDAIEASAINFFNESCQALGILVDLNKKRLATCKKCGKTNKECFPTTIEEYDMYIEMLCKDCLTEILDKKITDIKPKKIE